MQSTDGQNGRYFRARENNLIMLFFHAKEFGASSFMLDMGKLVFRFAFEKVADSQNYIRIQSRPRFF